MNERARALRQRQLALLLRSDQLRQRLCTQAQALQAPLAWADRARQAWQWLRTHPQWPLAGGVVLLTLRPRRTLRWAARLFWAWRVVGRLHVLLNRPPRA